MEKSSSNSAVFYIRAGWMYTDPHPGAGYRRTVRTEDASATVGSLDSTTKKYVVPTSNHAQSGEYYVGWYSGDPNGGTQPNGSIHVTYPEGTSANSAGGGRVHYTPDDTLPANNLAVTMTSLNTGRDMIITAHGFV